jgi:hypothetical protein
MPLCSYAPPFFSFFFAFSILFCYFVPTCYDKETGTVAQIVYTKFTLSKVEGSAAEGSEAEGVEPISKAKNGAL